MQASEWRVIQRPLTRRSSETQVTPSGRHAESARSTRRTCGTQREIAQHDATMGHGTCAQSARSHGRSGSLQGYLTLSLSHSLAQNLSHSLDHTLSTLTLSHTHSFSIVALRPQLQRARRPDQEPSHRELAILACSLPPTSPPRRTALVTFLPGGGPVTATVAVAIASC